MRRTNSARQREGDRDEQRTAPAPPGRATAIHVGVAARGADQRQRRLARARRSSARQSANWPSSGIMCCLAGYRARSVWPLRAACCARFERLGGFGRHVVLVVLGQHLARDEHAVGAELALRDHALAFLEQVGKDAGVDDRDRLRGVGHDEAHRRVPSRFTLPSSTRPPMRKVRALRRFLARRPATA